MLQLFWRLNLSCIPHGVLEILVCFLEVSLMSKGKFGYLILQLELLLIWQIVQFVFLIMLIMLYSNPRWQTNRYITLWKKIRCVFQKSMMFIWNFFSHYTLKCNIYLGIQLHSVLLKAPLSFITVSIPEQMSFRCEKSIIPKTSPVVIWVD